MVCKDNTFFGISQIEFIYYLEGLGVVAVFIIMAARETEREEALGRVCAEGAEGAKGADKEFKEFKELKVFKGGAEGLAAEG